MDTKSVPRIHMWNDIVNIINYDLHRKEIPISGKSNLLENYPFSARADSDFRRYVLDPLNGLHADVTARPYLLYEVMWEQASESSILLQRKINPNWEASEVYANAISLVEDWGQEKGKLYFPNRTIFLYLGYMTVRGNTCLAYSIFKKGIFSFYLRKTIGTTMKGNYGLTK